MKIKLIIIISIFMVKTLSAQELESILKIKPEVKYDENLKYENINKYKENENNEIKLNYDFDIHINYNQELKIIEGIKIDVGTKF